MSRADRRAWRVSGDVDLDRRLFAAVERLGRAVRAARQQLATRHELSLLGIAVLETLADLRLLLGEIARLQSAGVISVNRSCLTCQHYQQPTTSSGARCLLLEAPLADTDLRVNCNEHEPALHIEYRPELRSARRARPPKLGQRGRHTA